MRIRTVQRRCGKARQDEINETTDRDNDTEPFEERGRSPLAMLTASIVSWTEPNRINAPVPAVRPRYASEKQIAYAASQRADNQLPFPRERPCSRAGY